MRAHPIGMTIRRQPQAIILPSASRVMPIREPAATTVQPPRCDAAGSGLPRLAVVLDGDRAYRCCCEPDPQYRLGGAERRLGALGVGGHIARDGSWSAPVNNTSINQGRSFGPASASGDWTADGVYVAGPLIGAAIAVGCAMILRGRGGSRETESGVLTPGSLEEEANLSLEIDVGKVVPPGLDQTGTAAGS